MQTADIIERQARLHRAIESGDRCTAASLLATNFSSCDISEDRPLARDEWLDVAIALRLRWRAVDDIDVVDMPVGLALLSGLYTVASVRSTEGREEMTDLWTPQEAGWALVVRRERPIPVHPSVGP